MHEPRRDACHDDERRNGDDDRVRRSPEAVRGCLRRGRLPRDRVCGAELRALRAVPRVRGLHSRIHLMSGTRRVHGHARGNAQ